jgi:hypothetical protein
VANGREPVTVRGHRSTLRRRSGVTVKIVDVVLFALLIAFAIGAAYVIATGVF